MSKNSSEVAKPAIETVASSVEFDRIETGFGNVRSHIPQDVVDDLVMSIRSKGLLQPLIVRHKHLKSKPHVLADGRAVWDRYELIAGNCRYAAIAQIRGEDKDLFAKVKVSLVYGNDEQMIAIQLTENLQRTDMAPMDIAHGMQLLINCGLTPAEVAVKVTRSVAYVTKMLALLNDAAGEVARAANRGEIGVDLAVDIAKLPEPEQKVALEEHRAKVAEVGSRAAVKATRAKITAASGGAPYAPPDKGDLRKLAKFLHENTTKPVGLSTDAIEAIQWMMGYRKTLPGLAQTLRVALPRKAKDLSPSDAE